MDTHTSYGKLVSVYEWVWGRPQDRRYSMGVSFEGPCHYAALRADNRLPACVAEPRRTNVFYEDPPIADQDTTRWTDIGGVEEAFYDGPFEMREIHDAYAEVGLSVPCKEGKDLGTYIGKMRKLYANMPECTCKTLEEAAFCKCFLQFDLDIMAIRYGK